MGKHWAGVTELSRPFYEIHDIQKAVGRKVVKKPDHRGEEQKS